MTELIQELHDEVVQKIGAELETLTIERVVVGIFFTGVMLNNQAAGMSATPIKSIPEAVCCPSSAKSLPMPGKLKGKPVRQLLTDLYCPHATRKALAIAALNALVETLWLRDGAPQNVTIGYGDAFSSIPIKSSQKVALVGAFPPYMRELRKRQIDFRVLEMDPATLKAEEMPFYAPADTAPQVIPQADILIATGTTLINGTLDALLGYLAPHARAAIIGPTTPLVADALARRGVTFIGGTRVLDGHRLLDILAEGGSGYHFFEKTVERITLKIP